MMENVISEVTVGTRVQITFGFGRKDRGEIVSIETNKWGTTAKVNTDGGDEEYVNTIWASGSGEEIGCHVI